MIELKAVSKTFSVSRSPVAALRTLDLEIPSGQFVSIVGHSGSGKSTLLSLIGGLARPDTGTVKVDGVDIWGFDDRSRSRMRNEKFGFIYQFSSLLPTLTAVENVLLPTAFGSARPRAAAVRLLERVGLGDKAARYPSQLSGGEQQRVAIARALANQPSILLADEPTGNLDVKNSGLVFDLLMQLAKEQGQAVILVTHNPEIAQRCDATRPMRDGVFL